MTESEPRLYRVIVPVSEIEKGVAFYRTLLGTEGRRVSPGRHYFDCGEVILAVYDPRADGDEFEARPNPDHLYFAVADLEAAYQRAVAANPAWLEDAIQARPWGERSFYLRDPFENPLCIVEEGTVFTGREGSKSERK